MNERIKELRKRLNLTQQEFADRLSIKRGAVANYEVGRNTPSDSVIALICREFNVSERWLREGEGEMFLPQDDADALMALAGRFLGSEPTEFQQSFVRMILSLSPEEWKLLERKARELLGETKKED